MDFCGKCFDNLFLILCIFFSGWFVKLQLEYYLENEDIASISFRKIEGGNDQYPTYTICLFSDEGKIFHQDSASWNFPHITPFYYHEFLRGFESNTNQSEEEFMNLIYDEVSVSMFDGFLLYFLATRSNGSEIVIYGNEAKEYFHISHQDFKRICYTKVIRRELFFIQESLVLNVLPQNRSGVGFEIYVHQQGTIHRNIPGKNALLIPPTYSSYFYREIFHHVFSIDGIEVLQRRENGRIPCNQSIENEDVWVKEMIMSDVGCIPSFWNQSLPNLTPLSSLAACEREQYGTIYKLLENRGRNKHNMYLHPCNQIHFNEQHKDTKHIPIRNGDNTVLYGALSFHFTTELYKEIVDTQKFTFETLFAQIGGFVGMFYDIYKTTINVFIL